MLQIRRGAERGRAQLSWLESRFTFSFAEYYDPAHMGFRSLRVINDDIIAPAAGFGTHAHRDMEILTYVLDGELAHRDSLGNGSTIRPGEIQRMSAGTGIQHSEMNLSRATPVHLLQIWILPDRQGLAPSYEQKTVDLSSGKLQQIAGAYPQPDAVTIHQDANVFAAKLTPTHGVEHEISTGRYVWLHVATGEVECEGEVLAAGDAAAFQGPTLVRVQARQATEVLLFDLS